MYICWSNPLWMNVGWIPFGWIHSWANFGPCPAQVLARTPPNIAAASAKYRRHGVVSKMLTSKKTGFLLVDHRFFFRFKWPYLMVRQMGNDINPMVQWPYFMVKWGMKRPHSETNPREGRQRLCTWLGVSALWCSGANKTSPQNQQWSPVWMTKDSETPKKWHIRSSDLHRFAAFLTISTMASTSQSAGGTSFSTLESSRLRHFMITGPGTEKFSKQL